MALSKDYSFDSARLHFRGIQKSDAEDIVRWRSNPENYRFFLDPRPITLDEHLAWFECYMEDDSRYDFIIFDPDGLPIGTVGLSNISGDSCEINYMIGEESARGKGYATEAVGALTKVAFSELNVHHVEARILSDNEASMHVARNCGYTEAERVFRISR